jgi:photosystem II stability/assembly factor-like uncharacterized protein
MRGKIPAVTRRFAGAAILDPAVAAVTRRFAQLDRRILLPHTLRIVSIILTASFGLAALQGTTQEPWTPQSSGIDVSLRGVSAVDARVAWASGARGTVLRTVDGGTTWERRLVESAGDLDLRDVDAFDASVAYALSIGSGADSRIFKTVDGGATWETQFVNQEPAAFFDAMDFWDPRRGVAVSDSVDGRFVIVRTADGGDTWTPVPAEGLPAALPGEGYFAASGSNVTTWGSRHVWAATGAAAQARVLRSTDGGDTWEVAVTPIPAGPTSGIYSIAFRDADHGVVVGGDYRREGEAIDNVAITRDGGRTWSLVEGAGLSGFRSAVAYVPGRSTPELFAVGPSGADYSRDDGLTWTPVPGPGFHALAIAANPLDGAVGWAVGSSGRIGHLDPAGLR